MVSAKEEYRAAIKELLPAENLARCLIQIRMDLNISQGELAKKLCVSKQTIIRLEEAFWN